jgi:phosphatidylinositol-3-phosphatase
MWLREEQPMRDLCRRFAALAVAGAMASFVGVPSFAGNREGRVTTAASEVRHVFLIVLENKTFSNTFGNSTQDPYLQKTLVPAGALLTQYYGTGHVSLDNYISLVSGQAPTPDTDDDCIPGLSGTAGNFNDVQQTGLAAQGQVVAKGGCVYSRHVRNITDQLVENGYSWKGYMEDMGNDPTRESSACGHPALGVGTDHTNEAEAPSAAVPLGDQYATRHDPFVYFHSVIDDQHYCDEHVVNLNVLTNDLKEERTTPNFVFITPNLCNDGHDGAGTGAAGTLCANGQPGGLTSADAFLQNWVPKIQASPAYQKDGLIIITFDESNITETVSANPTTGQETVLLSFPGQTCCHQQPGPNLTGVRPGTATLVNTPQLVEELVFNGFGGDQIGAVLLSKFVKPGSTSSVGYNHYSLLRSLEDIFQLREHLGYASDDPRIGYFLDTIGDDENVFKAQPRHGFGFYF